MPRLAKVVNVLAIEQVKQGTETKELTNLVGGREKCPMIIPYMKGPMSARI